MRNRCRGHHGPVVRIYAKTVLHRFVGRRRILFLEATRIYRKKGSILMNPPGEYMYLMRITDLNLVPPLYFSPDRIEGPLSRIENFHQLKFTIFYCVDGVYGMRNTDRERHSVMVAYRFLRCCRFSALPTDLTALFLILQTTINSSNFNDASFVTLWKPAPV